MYLTPIEVLQQIYGYHNFVGNQEQVIEHILLGRSALVMMPTGGGKSICYQIPALILDNVTIVISPLIALMDDQIDALKNLGINAISINSNLSVAEYKQRVQHIKSSKVKIIYTTPERAVSKNFINLLFSVQVSLFAIDEAHCISHWGHDFRVEYQHLSILKHKFPKVPIIALTATADNHTRIDILKTLRIPDAKIFIQSFNRPNISYISVEKKSAKQQLLTFLQSNKFNTGIVYCNSRNRVDDIHNFLLENNIFAIKYHAGMNIQDRQNSHRLFLDSNFVVMVATVAFGLGIDKPDVRFVYHLDLPKSLENFYQESGRAGRDGMPAISVINYGFRDYFQMMQMIVDSETQIEKQQLDLLKLRMVMEFCDSILCKRIILLKNLQEQIEPCGNCDICNNVILEENSVLAQKILSTIFKVGGKFSAKQIIDILRGKASYNVQVWDHHKLSTFGLCSEYSEQEIKRVIRQLYSQNFLEISSKNQTLQLNNNSLTILKGIKPFITKKPHQKNTYLHQEILMTELETRIWTELNKWRHAIAIFQKSSLHAVLSNRILFDIVKQKPVTMEALKLIAGIGSVRAQNVGQDVLNIVSLFIKHQEH
jgi:ATP-dependent DNA helicase RecQ